MYEYRIFDVEIWREVAFDLLGWPQRGEAADENGLGCNRSYMDMRGMSWATAKGVYAEETAIIEQIESADDPLEFYEQLEDEGETGIDGIDLGVASTVFALSAARCVPFSSCNAGAYGGSHAEHYPVVAFFSRPPIARILLECAEEVECGLRSSDDFLVVFADDIRTMRRFAQAVISRSKQFRALRLSGSDSPERGTGGCLPGI